MKNACILITYDEYVFTDADTRPVFDVLHVNGYAFDEVRTLRRFDANQVKNCLQDCMRNYENVVCLTDVRCFEGVYAIVSSLLPKSQSQNFGNTAGFAQEKTSCFLMTPETANTFLQSVCVPHLQKKYGVKFSRSVLRCVGASEAHVQSLFAQARVIDGGKARYAHTRRFADDTIEIFYDENVSKRVADDVMRIFADGLKDCIYAVDDTPLAEQLVSLLKIRGKKLSVAESFTGGGIARKVTAISGASEVYFEGINAYNERSKIKRLGVSEYTLNSFGAVSDNTAYEMAAGLISTGDCDLAIATTGLAGPKSDRSMLPVGLCYIAVGTKERVFVYRYKFDGTREQITETAINYALFLAYKQLKNV